MSEEQLEFPVVPGKRVKKAKPNDLDFEAHLRGRHFVNVLLGKPMLYNRGGDYGS